MFSSNERLSLYDSGKQQVSVPTRFVFENDCELSYCSYTMFIEQFNMNTIESTGLRLGYTYLSKTSLRETIIDQFLRSVGTLRPETECWSKFGRQ